MTAFSLTPISPDVDELDLYDAWFTPGQLVEQGLHATRILAGVRARRVLDLGAGAGVFGQRTARVWPNAERLGVEIRRSERPYLRRHYDSHLVGDMFRLRAKLASFGADLATSNPPYRDARETLELALSVVRIGGHVLFFVRGTFGSARTTWQKFFVGHPPIAELAVPGRPNMRQGISKNGHALGGDFVPHTWLLFRRLPPTGRPRWQRIPLPALDSQDLTWTARPGTERILPPFPSAYLPGA